MLGMNGTPWEPIPGRPNQHIPVNVTDNGEYLGPECEFEERPVEQTDDEADMKNVEAPRSSSTCRGRQ